jgi:hypothetical protein
VKSRPSEYNMLAAAIRKAHRIGPKRDTGKRGLNRVNEDDVQRIAPDLADENTPPEPAPPRDRALYLGRAKTPTEADIREVLRAQREKATSEETRARLDALLNPPQPETKKEEPPDA